MPHPRLRVSCRKGSLGQGPDLILPSLLLREVADLAGEPAREALRPFSWGLPAGQELGFRLALRDRMRSAPGLCQRLGTTGQPRDTGHRLHRPPETDVSFC